jgi:ligand-binding SRPBCC domain-containing protein
MICIELVTYISAPIQRCFDLSRSIDLHVVSTHSTRERAIAGVTSGLIGAQQEVTWSGRHFGFLMTHTSRITAYDPPGYFQDRMVRGAFKSFCHDHYFETRESKTLMRDRMEFEAPVWGVGLVLERALLRRHMLKLLLQRNDCIKRAAESDEWRQFLKS